MTNRTDQEIREAREWAEFITSMRVLQGEYASQARAAARFIMDNTDPPLPDPLFLAKATHPDYGEGIVISHFPEVDGTVRFMCPDEAFGDGTRLLWLNPSTLTFHPRTVAGESYNLGGESGADCPSTTISGLAPVDPKPGDAWSARLFEIDGVAVMTNHKKSADWFFVDDKGNCEWSAVEDLELIASLTTV